MSLHKRTHIRTLRYGGANATRHTVCPTLAIVAASVLVGCTHVSMGSGTAADVAATGQQPQHSRPTHTSAQYPSKPTNGESDLTWSGSQELSLSDAKTTGMASYYGSQFAGNLTANGERFDPKKMTAAHRTLPFGTRVLVTNLKNGRHVTVRINDRGPFVDSRIIDLSRGAAKRLNMLHEGTAKVRLQILSRGSSE